MFAKKPNPDLFDVERPNRPETSTSHEVAAEHHPHLVAEEVHQTRNDATTNRGKLLIFPPQPVRIQPTWPDYEELFPTAQDEATEAIAQVTDALINRRCYYQQYWPENTVFRIKDIDAEKNTVYLNLIYRWVSVNQVLLLKNLLPQRPPTGLELNYILDDDCSDF